jgi:hypothetical protein
MHMGYYAATNIHQQMQLATGKITEPQFLELNEIPPMIGLAVGKQAVSYWPAAGVDSGEEVMKVFFGEDLGFRSEYSFISFFRFYPSLGLSCVFGMGRCADWSQFAGIILGWGLMMRRRGCELGGGALHGVKSGFNF